MNKPLIIIHGASGFIGKNFTSYLLAAKYNIVIFSRETSDLGFLSSYSQDLFTIYLYKTSLTELENIEFGFRNNIVFFDFAWYGVFNEYRNSDKQFSINIPMTIHSVQLAKQCGALHWVGLGSQAEYGNVNHKIPEDLPCDPTTMYGKAKKIASNIAEELSISYGMEFTWLRLFSLYGPNDNHKWFVHYLIEELLQNRTIDMTQGEQLWDYLYIEDAVDVLYKLINHDGLGVTNFASGVNIRLKDFVLLAKEITNSNSTINFGSVPYRDNQVMNMEPDISKITNLLNWQPKNTYYDGLSKIIKSYNNRI